MLPSVTVCYRVIQSITDYLRVLQSTTKYYKILQVLQSITKTKPNLAHLLGPIFGLAVFISLSGNSLDGNL